jgi:hypothetical protein
VKSIRESLEPQRYQKYTRPEPNKLWEKTKKRKSYKKIRKQISNKLEPLKNTTMIILSYENYCCELEYEICVPKQVFPY